MKIVIVIIILLVLSSSAGVAIWGAASNWWGLGGEEKSSPSGTTRTPGTPSGTTGGSGAPGPSSYIDQLPSSGFFRLKLKNYNLYFEMSTSTSNGSKIYIKPYNSSSDYQLWSYESNNYIKNKGTGLFIEWDSTTQEARGWGDYFSGGNGRMQWTYDKTKMYLSSQNHNLEWSNWDANTGIAQATVYPQTGNGRQEILIEMNV